MLPTLPDRNESFLVGWSSGDSSEVLISSKSVKRFRSQGWSKFAFPIGFANSLKQTSSEQW